MHRSIEMRLGDPSLINWLAPENCALPDFIIGGAMKSGSSTLHRILSQHPKAYLPKGELHFFDIDNILQHSDFNFYDTRNYQWTSQRISHDPQKMWEWYSAHFSGNAGSVIGEDSTTYLASKIAAKRIAAQKKPIKLIFLLRHPTLRAYSHYYHLLRTGRAVHSFEDTLVYNPSSILQRSMYLEQLEWYFDHIPRDRIKIIVFENFIDQTKAVVKEICEFLGLDFEKLPRNALEIHSNKAIVPRNIKLQILKNRFFRSKVKNKYGVKLPNPFELSADQSRFHRVVDKLVEIINPHLAHGLPKMEVSTRKFLDYFFYDHLHKIDDLTGEEILSYWFDNLESRRFSESVANSIK